MKKYIFNFFLILGLAASTTACKNEPKNKVSPGEAEEAASPSEAAVTYKIDTTASTIEWRGTKPTGEHRGTIDIQNGQISASEDSIVSGQVSIDMTSITVTDKNLEDKDRTMLENHLKGTAKGKETDFFNVTKYPTAKFEITGITEEEGQKMLQGNLTLKDVTKNIQFPVSVKVNEDELTLESETFTIDRTQWNIKYGSKTVFDNLGDNFISDDMELTIKVKAKRS